MKNAKQWTIETKTRHSKSKWTRLTPDEPWPTKKLAQTDAEMTQVSNPTWMTRVVPACGNVSKNYEHV